MSFNLLRNSRVFFTTAVGTSGSGLGVIGGTGAPAISSTNTREIQVLDGFGFSQNTTSETVTLNETGAAPVRGQRSFNTQLDPVDFNMTTYIRPFRDTTGGYVTGITWGTTTAAVTAGSGASTALLTAYPANIVTASAATQAYAANYGLNTFIYASTPDSAGGTTATFAPIFGADPATPSYQKLIGIYLVNPGSGYASAPSITIVDPDSGAEATALPLVTASIAAGSAALITAEEKPLWNALFTGTGNANAWTDGASEATVVATSSNAHQLQRFGLIILIDTTCFLIDDCVLNTATIDFGIDAIASIQWAGQAKAIRRINAPSINDTSGYFQQKASETDPITQALFSAGTSTTFTKKTTAASFIANKLSVVTLKSNIGGVDITSPSTPTKTYNMPLTGGNLTISNNVSYLTPAVLGVVNQPATYFAGTRAISGSMTAYLRTGTNETAGLLGDLLSNATTDVDPAFYIKIAIGGSSATDRVEIEMPAVVLTIPTIATEQVISTTINFTAQGKSGTSGAEVFDLTQSNEINLKYYA